VDHFDTMSLVRKLFDRLKYEFEMKTTKEQGVGDMHFGSQHFEGVEGRAGTPAWD